MKKVLLHSFVFLLFLSTSFAQNSKSNTEANRQKSKEIIYNIEKMQGEIFQEELLIEVSDLDNVETKVKDRMENFVSNSEFFTYHGMCYELNIIKIKINKGYFTNYNDVKAKIADREISRSFRLLNGTFSDLDSLCN